MRALRPLPNQTKTPRCTPWAVLSLLFVTIFGCNSYNYMDRPDPDASRCGKSLRQASYLQPRTSLILSSSPAITYDSQSLDPDFARLDWPVTWEGYGYVSHDEKITYRKYASYYDYNSFSHKPHYRYYQRYTTHKVGHAQR